MQQDSFVAPARFQYLVKMFEIVIRRSNHRLPFAFFAASRELTGADRDTASREGREAAKNDFPKGKEFEHRNVRSAMFRQERSSSATCEGRCSGCCTFVLSRRTRLHCSMSDVKISEVPGPGLTAVNPAGKGYAGTRKLNERKI